MLEDQDGALWFGTLGKGLLESDPKSRRFVRYRNDPGDPESLAQDSLSSLFQDHEGNIWAGLYMMAPNRFSTRQPLFEKFRHVDGNPNSLSDTMVNAIYEDSERTLWISSTRALNRIDRISGKYTYYGIKGLGVNIDANAIIEDRSGAFWVGTAGHGLNRLDRKTGRFTTLRHNPSDPFSLSSDLITRLLIAHKGGLWAATFDGLDRFDSLTSHFTVYKADKQSSAETYIELQEDRGGALWIGTHYSGLLRFDPNSGTFTSYTRNSVDPGTLSDNRVLSVHFDRSGKMWIGTQNGLDRFDSQTGRFTPYYERDGLPGNVVSCILEDKLGNLWMSTNNGLSEFDPSKNTFKNYSTAD
jgi:ligand-binding sensor domain-containing protein